MPNGSGAVTANDRIDEFERRLRGLELELSELRRLLAVEEAAPQEPAEPPPTVTTEPPRGPEPFPPPGEQPTAAPPRWFEQSHDFQASDLLGARALAWAGGIVTVLGIVLFFALAVNRGWIGPGARVGLGAIAAAVVFGGGVYLRRRFGETYSALSAVGAGIAGGYATLLAAGPHYDLLPDWASLAVAAGIAALALAIALHWSSELVAGLGLVGAMVVQIPIAWGDGLTISGTGFTAFMFAASVVVVVARRWETLLTVSAIAVVPQVIALAAEHAGDAPAGALAAAVGCAAVLLAAAVGLQLRSEAELAAYPASVAIGAGVFASLSLAILISGSRLEGLALLAVAAAYAALAAVFFTRPRHADLSALLAAVGLAIGAVAVADLLSGPSLGIAWAAEAAVLAWLARQIDDVRYQLGSLAYLGLAIGHALLIDTPPRHLFTERLHPAAGVAAPVAVAVASAVFASRCNLGLRERRTAGEFSLGDPFDWLRTSQLELRFGTAWLAGIAGLYAASLGLLELPPPFAWNHVAITGLLVLVALAALVAGLMRRWRSVQAGAGLLFAVALAKVVGFDVPKLDAPQRSWAMLAIGAALLLAGFLSVRLTPGSRGLDPFAVAGIAPSLAFGIAAPFDLLNGRWHGIDRTGAALLALAAVYAVLSALVFAEERLRDVSTLLWGSALLVGVLATELLVSDTPLALVWAGVVVVLIGLFRWTGEERLQAGAAAYLALAVGHALVFDAPPTDFFESNRHPASGAGAVAGAAVAALSLALVVRIPERLRVSRAPVFALAGALATYAVSLVILELFELGGGRIETKFERGHATVSAVWGVLALMLLYLGLTRRLSLRLAGFALFGVTLAKIFLYDLSTLSPVARALSFLAVGAVLLLGGFFYQRLSADAVDGGEATGR
jgi:uncharacterized membrane protein